MQPAQERFILIKVPCMGGISATDIAIGAGRASGACLGSITTKSLEAVQPYIHKIIRMDIALHKFRPVFNVQARADISIAADAGDCDACAAQEVVIPNHALGFHTEIMGYSRCRPIHRLP